MLLESNLGREVVAVLGIRDGRLKVQLSDSNLTLLANQYRLSVKTAKSEETNETNTVTCHARNTLL